MYSNKKKKGNFSGGKKATSKTKLTVTPINKCELQGNMVDAKFSKTANGLMFSGRLLIDKNRSVFLRAFDDIAKMLYKKKVKAGDPIHVMCQYSIYRTQNNDYIHQFIIEEILDVVSNKKTFRLDDITWDTYDTPLDNDEDNDEDITEEEEEEEEEDGEIWS